MCYNNISESLQSRSAWGGFCFTGRNKMLKSCSFCGKIHDFNTECPKRIEYRKRLQAKYDRSGYSYERNSKADIFRNTKVWQRKRNEIRQRDLNMCRYCFLIKHRITTQRLSVHHICPLAVDFDKRLDNNNLITLCSQCHEQAESGKISKKKLISLIFMPIRLDF